MMYSPALALLVPIAVTMLLTMVSAHRVTPGQGAAAFLLLLFPCASYLNWKATYQHRLPLFAMLAFLHWLYFALPLFLGGRRVQARLSFNASDASITAVMWLTVIGVCCLWAGMKLSWVPWQPARFPDISPAHSRQLLYVALLGGTLLNASSRFETLLGESGRNAMVILSTVVPLTALVILMRQWLAGQATELDKTLVVAALAARVIFGLASGWAGGVAFLGIMCVAVYASERRRLPWVAVAVAVPTFLFLQVGKESFRRTYWMRDASGSVVERLVYWAQASFRQWSNVLDANPDGDPSELASKAFQRVSLLEQASNVVEKTPSAVDFQNGKTYSYLLVTFIPRFLWPDKPSVSEANRQYQVDYGLTHERDLDRVSISVGFLMEGYLNFGRPGVAAACFLVGLLLGAFAKTFLAPESGFLWAGLGFALSAPLLSIEWQAGQYLSGLVQQILLTVAVYYPVLGPRHTRAQEAAS